MPHKRKWLPAAKKLADGVSGSLPHAHLIQENQAIKGHIETRLPSGLAQGTDHEDCDRLRQLCKQVALEEGKVFQST